MTTSGRGEKWSNTSIDRVHHTYESCSDTYAHVLGTVVVARARDAVLPVPVAALIDALREWRVDVAVCVAAAADVDIAMR